MEKQISFWSEKPIFRPKTGNSKFKFKYNLRKNPEFQKTVLEKMRMMPTELVSQEEGYMTLFFITQGREKEVINFGNRGLVEKTERVGCFTRQTSLVSEKTRCRDCGSSVAGGGFHCHTNRKHGYVT